MWTDTTYHRNPDAAEKVVKKLEAEQLDFIKAGSGAKF
jgi:hypothetical protein